MATLAELIVRVGANVGGLERGFGAAQKEVDLLVKRTQPLAADFSAVGKAVGAAGLAVGAGLGHAVSVAADFEAAMSDVSSVSGASGREMEKLEGLALEMGASTKYSALEAAGGMGELLKAGVDTGDVLEGGLAGALSLAAAGDLSVAESAAIAAKALNVFSLDGAETVHVADLLAAAANKSATDVHNMGAAFNQSASVAANLGVPIEHLSGTLALFAQKGLEGSDAGTSLKTMLMRLNPQSAEAAAKMEELGLKFFTSKGEFIGVTALAQQLQTQLGGLTQEQRQSALATIFGSDAIRAATELYKAGGTGVTEWIGKVDDSGAAARIAAEKQNNLKGAIEELGGSIETAEIQIGSKLVPGIRTLTEAVKGGVDWFNNLSPAMQETVATGGALFAGGGIIGGGLLLLVGQIPNVIQGFSALKTVMGGLSTVATGTGAAMKAALLAPVGAANALQSAILGVGAAYAGWKIGEWIRNNTELGASIRQWGGEMIQQGDQILRQNEKLLAQQGLMTQSSAGLATVTKLMMLAEESGIVSKERLLARYAPLIKAMEQEGEAGKRAFDQAITLYDFDKRRIEQIQKTTEGIQNQRDAFADYLASQEEGKQKTEESRSVLEEWEAQLNASTVSTEAATEAQSASARVLGTDIPAAAGAASAALQRLDAQHAATGQRARGETMQLATVWATEPSQAMATAAQAVQSWEQTHNAAVASATIKLRNYSDSAKVSLTIVEDQARKTAFSLASLGGEFGSLNLDQGFKGLQGTIIGVGGMGTYNGGLSGGVPVAGPAYAPWSNTAMWGNIPGAATGGDVLRGGSTLVGEQGPELLDLPRGARITPLPAGGPQIINYVTNNYITVEGGVVGEDEIWRLARRGGIRHRRSNTSAALA